MYAWLEANTRSGHISKMQMEELIETAIKLERLIEEKKLWEI
jgi:hypothetical protein